MSTNRKVASLKQMLEMLEMSQVTLARLTGKHETTVNEWGRYGAPKYVSVLLELWQHAPEKTKNRLLAEAGRTSRPKLADRKKRVAGLVERAKEILMTSPDVRYSASGLAVELANNCDITAQTIRKFYMGEVLPELTKYFDPATMRWQYRR